MIGRELSRNRLVGQYPRKPLLPRTRARLGPCRVSALPVSVRGCAIRLRRCRPRPRHDPVDLIRPCADHHFPGDELLAPTAGACPRHPQRPAGAQAGDQLALAARRVPARKGPGRSPRARSASTHHRGSRSGSRLAICSGLHAVAHAAFGAHGRAVAGPRRHHRSEHRPAVRAAHRPGQPVLHLVRAAARWRRAWLTSDYSRFRSAFHCATYALSLPVARCNWPRCYAAPATPMPPTVQISRVAPGVSPPGG